MADTKITALTALTAADPSTDVLPIVDTSDTTMAASGTTKKISINNILGASGTATLASATITGDLTVDTSTLKVDSANNRVGIGTATPVATLQSNGTLTISGGTAASTANGLHLYFNTGTNTALISAFHSGVDNRDLTIDGKTIGFSLAGSTAMTLNSTGLGVGVSPLAKIHSSTNVAAANFDWTTTFISPTVGLLAASNNSSAWIRIATLDSNPTHDPYVNFLTSGGQNWSVGIDNSDSDKFKITLANGFIGSNEFVIIDTTGNVGIGVTPSYLLHTAVASGANRNMARFQVTGASNGLTITWNHATTKMIVNFSDLPTSSAGLVSGDLWIDTAAGNTLKVA